MGLFDHNHLLGTLQEFTEYTSRLPQALPDTIVEHIIDSLPRYAREITHEEREPFQAIDWTGLLKLFWWAEAWLEEQINESLTEKGINFRVKIANQKLNGIWPTDTYEILPSVRFSNNSEDPEVSNIYEFR